jgi:hypothetical protein
MPSQESLPFHRPTTRVGREDSVDEECTPVLQGRGALGVHQSGVFEPLAQAYAKPTWVAGSSIGAINAALIAGKPAASRIAPLREFRQLHSPALPAPLVAAQAQAREGLGRPRCASGVRVFDRTADRPSAA